MPLLSPLRKEWPIFADMSLLHRGKVRDTYQLKDDELLLVVATDSVSIFDFVLNCMIPQKGKVLAAMTHFWLDYLETVGIKTHFVTAGSAIDSYLPKKYRHNRELQSRAIVVKKLTMPKVEFIARNALTGSALSAYKKTGMVAGVKLPGGLQDGDGLLYMLDTPTTKAEVGHDLPLLADDIRKQYPKETELLLQIANLLKHQCATKGIYLADLKLEIGLDRFGTPVVGDEVGTPDSCRFWDMQAWRDSRMLEMRKAPPPNDKQFLRMLGIEWGINDESRFDPTNPADVARVHALVVPQETVHATSDLYLRIFRRLTGMSLEEYQIRRLKIQ